jgi:hypothetical protein
VPLAIDRVSPKLTLSPFRAQLQDRHLASARGMGILPMIPRTRVARVKIVSETVLMYAYVYATTGPEPFTKPTVL